MKNPKRDFIFIDETGDPGQHGTSGSSLYYLAGCTHVTDIEMTELLNHFISLRYFNNFTKELKPLISNVILAKKLADIIKWHIDNKCLRVSIVYLEKSRFKGPYLGSKPLFFRNFVLRQLLEKHFTSFSLLSNECELVFDRNDMTLRTELNFRNYLLNNWNLPSFRHITLADSRYVECLQVIDFIIRMAREIFLDQNSKYKNLDLDFLDIADISETR